MASPDGSAAGRFSGFPDVFPTLCRTGPVPDLCPSTARPCRRTERRGVRRGTGRQGTGRSRGGLTGRAVAVVDALGHPVRFTVLPGQTRDLRGGPELPEGLRFGTLAGDRASGADWLLEDPGRRGAGAVIPARRNRTEPREHDRERCGWRHRTGNPFAETREFRAIATRCDRTATSFAAGIHLVAGVAAAA